MLSVMPLISLLLTNYKNWQNPQKCQKAARTVSLPVLRCFLISLIVIPRFFFLPDTRPPLPLFPSLRLSARHVRPRWSASRDFPDFQVSLPDRRHFASDRLFPVMSRFFRPTDKFIFHMKKAPGKIPRALFYHNYYAVLSDHGNDLLRTFRRAGATSGTFLLIDVCHIV